MQAFRPHPADRRFYATMAVVAAAIILAGFAAAIAGLVIAFLLVGPVHDLATRRRVHPAYAGLLLAVFIVPPVVARLSATAAWSTFAGWLTA